MTKSARSLHQAAELAREAKEYDQALALYAEALQGYVSAKDVAGVAELHASVSIVYRHLADQSADAAVKDIWIAQVESEVERSVKFAQLAAQAGNTEALALALFNQAKFFRMKGDLARSSQLFEQALAWFEKDADRVKNRPAVWWDFKLKLALAYLAEGEVTAVSDVLTALEALAQMTGPDADYNTKVWRSGGYLQLAEYYGAIDPMQAREYLHQAEAIVQSDARLLIRKQECKKFRNDWKIVN